MSNWKENRIFEVFEVANAALPFLKVRRLLTTVGIHHVLGRAFKDVIRAIRQCRDIWSIEKPAGTSWFAGGN